MELFLGTSYKPDGQFQDRKNDKKLKYMDPAF
jgi:hypothetical protein